MDAVIRRLALIAFSLIALSADAAPDRQTLRQAGRRFKEGDQAYSLGDYVTAIAAFEDAYRLSEDPIVLFNIAQSYRKQYGVDNDRARLVRARDLYRTFLRESSDTGLKSQAEGVLAEVEQLLAQPQQPAPPPVAQAPPAPVPPPTALPPAATSQTDAEGTEGATQAAFAPTPWYKRTWVWVAVGVAAAGAGAGVFLATRSSENAGEFCPGGCPTATVPVE